MAMSAFFIVAALCMVCRPSIHSTVNDVEMAQFPGWPETFDGDVLVEEPQSEFEEKFAQNFPGRIGRFRAGRRTVILRWTTRPTHRVHGAAYCLRATGWRIEPLPLEGDGAGVWTAFRATWGGEALNVREQVRGADGTTFADVPDWFFNALLGRTAGPWWIVTVAE